LLQRDSLRTFANSQTLITFRSIQSQSGVFGYCFNSVQRQPFNIEAIEVVLGEEKLRVADINPNFSKVIEKTGIPYVYRSRVDATELAVLAASQLLNNHSVALDQIRCLIVVSQSPRLLLPGISSEVHSRMKLPSNCISLDVSQGCSGFVQGLLIANSFLESDSKALLICTDTYRSKLDVDDRSTSSIFSDGASASLISSDPLMRIDSEAHYSEGSGARFLFQSIDHSTNGGFLYMAGSDVYVFTKRVVERQVRSVVQAANREPSEIDCVYPHQASLMVLNSLQQALADFRQVRNSVRTYGNLVSSSIPTLLREDLETWRSQRSVLVGFGVGLSCSTVLLSPYE